MDAQTPIAEPALAPPRGARLRLGNRAIIELDVRIDARILADDGRSMPRGQPDAVDAAGSEPAQLLERGGAEQHVVGDRV